jgi:predicted nucleotidyltransferase
MVLVSWTKYTLYPVRRYFAVLQWMEKKSFVFKWQLGETCTIYTKDAPRNALCQAFCYINSYVEAMDEDSSDE